ncbi:hypothetical protein ATO10_09333 [Actibacterium atlanticum]|uniref:CTP synthetase n=1 Tax=Actibacterium atlanticum TaxID=1461693 RepID=A0A058ZKD4_9RHOB|nr:hypothetical protein [Actibacterium atlanticum]KCV82038.1 hypothetical protein ATO10_09333 [Actibacterium atlanticum]
MMRLAMILFSLISTTLMGTGIVIALVAGFTTLMPLLIAIAAGFALSIPATWVVTKAVLAA